MSGSSPHPWITIKYTNTGEVPEWLNGLVSKTSVGQPTGGSNPSLSAILERGAHNNEQVGEVSERLNEHAWKACVSATAPGVRIPPSPPFSRAPLGAGGGKQKSKRARRWARSHAVGRVRTGSGRERSSPKGLESSARCPGPPAGSLHPGRAIGLASQIAEVACHPGRLVLRPAVPLG